MENNYWFNNFIYLTLFVETGKEKKDFSIKEKIDEVILKEIASEEEALSFNIGLDMRTAIFLETIRNRIKLEIHKLHYIGVYNFKNFGEGIYFIGGFTIEDDKHDDPGDFTINFMGYMIAGYHFKKYENAIYHILECVRH